MNYTGTQIIKTVYWSSQDGKFAVVRGPFPTGFPRTRAFESMDKAIKESFETIRSRIAPGTSERFAKVLMRWIVPDKNDLGDIAP